MKIAVITGGNSSEREVALASLDGVRKALKGKLELFVYDFPKDMDRFLTDRETIDAVIPVMHGRGGEDGQLQGFLETLSVPYIFSGIGAHAIAIDKALTKHIVRELGMNTPDYRVLAKGDSTTFEHSIVVKAIHEGSSKGVVIVKTKDELEGALQKAFSFSGRVLLEDFVQGREFTVGIIEENGQAVALPVSEIIVKDGFFDYEHKYDEKNLAEEICPAEINDDLRLALQEEALKAHLAIGARHLSRSDFIVDSSGTLWFLEINTIPGMTATSFIPKMIKESGRDFGSLLVKWLEELL